MRLVHRLFLTSVLGLAAVALAASPASALTVTQEPGNTACPAGPTVVAHVVTGGCHATFASNGALTMLAHTGAAEVVISSCSVSGELRVDSAGVGFLTNQILTGSPSNCTRRACDEAGNMRKIPWPKVLEGTVAAPTAEMTFCLIPTSAAEGTAGAICTIHGLATANGHTYTISTVGLPSNEAACEQIPTIEVVGSATSTATERIEIS